MTGRPTLYFAYILSVFVSQYEFIALMSPVTDRACSIHRRFLCEICSQLSPSWPWRAWLRCRRRRPRLPLPPPPPESARRPRSRRRRSRSSCCPCSCFLRVGQPRHYNFKIHNTINAICNFCQNLIIEAGQHYVGRQVGRGKGLVEFFLMSSPSSLGSMAAAVSVQLPVEHL